MAEYRKTQHKGEGTTSVVSAPGDGRRSPADELLRAVVAQIDRHRRELNTDPGLRQVRLTVRFREGRIRYAQIERASESDFDGEYED